ncbi:MAG TPA: hypothetical protein VKO43_01285, partial [Candidatus Krumholzibacteriaceae bacterium]|nr:hypothetical protein [Candidatus Krumholzibacteriaceae bacterium]
KYYLEKLNISPNQKELLAYNFLCDNEYDKVDLNSLESFFYEVILKNREIIYFPIKEFEKMIILKYWRVCKEKGGEGVKSFRNSKLSNNIPYPFSIYIKSLLYSIF